MMRRRTIPSGLELQTLLAVADLEDEAFGLDVRHEVSERSGHDYSVGAVYTTLGRLEDKGWVTSTLTDPLPVRGGRARKQFKVSAEGRRALAAARRQAEQLWRPTTVEGN